MGFLDKITGPFSWVRDTGVNIADRTEPQSGFAMSVDSRAPFTNRWREPSLTNTCKKTLLRASCLSVPLNPLSTVNSALLANPLMGGLKSCLAIELALESYVTDDEEKKQQAIKFLKDISAHAKHTVIDWSIVFFISNFLVEASLVYLIPELIYILFGLSMDVNELLKTHYPENRALLTQQLNQIKEASSTDKVTDPKIGTNDPSNLVASNREPDQEEASDHENRRIGADSASIFKDRLHFHPETNDREDSDADVAMLEQRDDVVMSEEDSDNGGLSLEQDRVVSSVDKVFDSVISRNPISSDDSLSRKDQTHLRTEAINGVDSGADEATLKRREDVVMSEEDSDTEGSNSERDRVVSSVDKVFDSVISSNPISSDDSLSSTEAVVSDDGLSSASNSYSGDGFFIRNQLDVRRNEFELPDSNESVNDTLAAYYNNSLNKPYLTPLYSKIPGSGPIPATTATTLSSLPIISQPIPSPAFSEISQPIPSPASSEVSQPIQPVSDQLDSSESSRGRRMSRGASSDKNNSVDSDLRTTRDGTLLDSNSPIDMRQHLVFQQVQNPQATPPRSTLRARGEIGRPYFRGPSPNGRKNTVIKVYQRKNSDGSVNQKVIDRRKTISSFRRSPYPLRSQSQPLTGVVKRTISSKNTVNRRSPYLLRDSGKNPSSRMTLG